MELLKNLEGKSLAEIFDTKGKAIYYLIGLSRAYCLALDAGLENGKTILREMAAVEKYLEYIEGELENRDNLDQPLAD